jgi:hypothetical protein
MVLVAVIGAAVLANIYFLIAAKRASETGIAPPTFVRALEWLFQHNPALSSPATAAFVIVALGLGLLSAYTFTRRRTHVE